MSLSFKNFGQFRLNALGKGLYAAGVKVESQRHHLVGSGNKSIIFVLQCMKKLKPLAVESQQLSFDN